MSRAPGRAGARSCLESQKLVFRHTNTQQHIQQHRRPLRSVKNEQLNWVEIHRPSAARERSIIIFLPLEPMQKYRLKRDSILFGRFKRIQCRWISRHDPAAADQSNSEDSSSNRAGDSMRWTFLLQRGRGFPTLKEGNNIHSAHREKRLADVQWYVNRGKGCYWYRTLVRICVPYFLKDVRKFGYSDRILIVTTEFSSINTRPSSVDTSLRFW